MQGASSAEERLRFEWTPVLVWRVRSTGELQGICYGWNRTVCLCSRGGEVIDKWIYDFYYDQAAKQPKEQSFDNWLGDLYQADLAYLNNSLWDWIRNKFAGTALVE